MAQALGLKVIWLQPTICLVSIALIGCAIAFQAWPIVLLFLLFLAGALLGNRPRPIADAAAGARTIQAVPDPSLQTRQTHMSQIVDQILMHRPHLLEARLTKASILWHIHGDRDGARCHCRDLLGRIERDNPLFEQVCNLYMRTCQPAPSRSTPPGIKSASEAGFPEWTEVAGLGRGKVVPLSSKRPHLTPQ